MGRTGIMLIDRIINGPERTGRIWSALTDMALRIAHTITINVAQKVRQGSLAHRNALRIVTNRRRKIRNVPIRGL